MPEPVAVEANEVKYPEHEKLQKVVDKSQAIGEFIDWLRGEKKIVFCKYVQEPVPDDDENGYYNEDLDDVVKDMLLPTSLPIEETLAEYFGIDLNKLEAEKRQMIDECRKANAAK